MPPRAKPGCTRISRTTLLVKKAQEKDDPLCDIPELLHFVSSQQAEGKKAEGAKAAAPEDTSPDSTCGMSDQGLAASESQPGAPAGVLEQDAPHPPDSSDTHFTVRHYTSSSLPAATMQWAFGLVKRHLQHMYEPVWGWSDKKKLAQLHGPGSRFIVMETEQPDGSSSPAAYINYRLEPYDGQPVLYLYEVMVDSAFQRMGLGSRLMHVVESVAWSLAMSRCVLTEFSANKAAEAFYRKLGYRPDATNPKNPTCGYLILSKPKPASA